jgi:hypothetical protein
MRQQGIAALTRRLERGIVEGELSEAAEPDALAVFYTAVLEGLSIRARDGTPRETLVAVVDLAMAAWDTLTNTPAAGKGLTR